MHHCTETPSPSCIVTRGIHADSDRAQSSSVQKRSAAWLFWHLAAGFVRSLGFQCQNEGKSFLAEAASRKTGMSQSQPWLPVSQCWCADSARTDADFWCRMRGQALEKQARKSEAVPDSSPMHNGLETPMSGVPSSDHGSFPVSQSLATCILPELILDVSQVQRL